MMDNDQRRTSKMCRVKDKTPAPVQITAEQLLREAKIRESELKQPSNQRIADESELKDIQMRQRKTFEDAIRRNRNNISNWLKYAAWESSQKNLRHARSVFERSLEVDYKDVRIWLKYSEMEMKNKQVNSARNILDRAVLILPRVDQLWQKYVYMEEMLGNVAGCRQIFERWMEWQPEQQAWHTYINFEMKHKEPDRARRIYESFVDVHPDVKNWIKYSKFEEKLGRVERARTVFDRSVVFYGEEFVTEDLIVAFAKFEERHGQHDTVRRLYKWALDNMPKEQCREIRRLYVLHEKKGHRGPNDGDEAFVDSRKFHYEELLTANPFNYDAWFDLLRLMESVGSPDVVGNLYEKAVANVPPSLEKNDWRRYIYLWIYYALYEEEDANDVERTRKVYRSCLDAVPHKKFTFAKIWVMFAKFEIRQGDLTAARKIMGTAIGKCPKDKLFREYIDLELQMFEFDRCRTLYQKFVLFSPENCAVWTKFAEMEDSLTDTDRARAIFEVGISQPLLDMPEVLWKAFIDFETNLGEFNRVRELYRRLLEKTSHIKVWTALALFELSTGEENCIEKSRKVYEEVNRSLKEAQLKEERVVLLEKWKNFEYEYGDEESMAAVEELQPMKELRSRKVESEGSAWNWEEYYEYVFPDEKVSAFNNLLAKAKEFAKQS